MARGAMKPERQVDWDRLKTMALSLGLPGVEETTSRGQPTLKAHGKLWVWWSPHEDAPVFKVPLEEREILDLEWAKANLIKVWRAQAPKRVLEAYDAAQPRTKQRVSK